MKKNQCLIQGTLLVCVSIISTAALAGTVIIPNTFSSGTAAVAAEVNANFNAVKTEVDDNASEIYVIKEQVAVMADDVDNLKSGAGAVSVAAQAFRDDESNSNCQWRSSVWAPGGYYRSGGATNCNLVAGIQIPHGAVVKDLACTVYDDTTLGSIRSVRLVGTNLITGLGSIIFETGGSVDFSSTNQQVFDTTVSSPEDAEIDNFYNAYAIHVEFSAATDIMATNVRLYGCSVSY